MNSKKPEKIDEVAISAKNIQQRMPDDWARIIGYIRKQAYPFRLDAESTEAVKAEYHRKAMAVQFLKKFNEIEG